MTGVRHPPPTVVLPGLRERWAPGGWECASPPPQPPPSPQNAATARQVALAQSVMCRRWAGAFDLNATFRRFAVSLTSSPCCVLVAWRPHSGLWRPAGLWRISCPPGLATLGSRPPFCPLVPTIFCAQHNVRWRTTRPRWRTPLSESTVRLLAVMLELHSHVLGKNCRRDKINTHVTNRFN